MKKYSGKLHWKSVVENYNEKVKCKNKWKSTMEKYNEKVQWKITKKT